MTVSSPSPDVRGHRDVTTTIFLLVFGQEHSDFFPRENHHNRVIIPSLSNDLQSFYSKPNIAHPGLGCI